jgi:hypothetical protein
MITYTPGTPLEAAILESGHFELATDSSGREVLVVGHRRMPKVVIMAKADGIGTLMSSVATTGSRAFSVTDGNPWHIEEDGLDGATDPTAAEEYLVMGLRPLRMEGRHVRIAVRKEIVRLFVLPWTIPARTVTFDGTPHYMVTSTRGVVGDWEPSVGGRVGVVVGILDRWVGLFERYRRPGTELVFRCDVPVPCMGEAGLTNAVPTVVGVFERPADVGLGSQLGGGPPVGAGGGVGAGGSNGNGNGVGNGPGTSSGNGVGSAFGISGLSGGLKIGGVDTGLGLGGDDLGINPLATGERPFETDPLEIGESQFGIDPLEIGGDFTETWIAKVPVVMIHGSVVGPVHVPDDIDIDEVPEGPWESEVQGLSDFSIASLT